MASKRSDQLHSYQFMVQRVVSALVMRDTDPAQSPFRRAAGATLASVLIALIVGAGFGIYGVFSNRGDSDWKVEGAVVIEKETGARFVFLSGKLHPAMNLASALLAFEGQPQLFTVSRKSLEGVQRGTTLGVPALPDSLPPKDQLLGLPWSVCSSGAEPKSALVVGDANLAADGRRLGDESAILVQAPVTASVRGRQAFLLWHGHRYELGKGVTEALDAGNLLTVSPAFINAVPPGVAIEVPRIDSVGQPSATHPDLVNGQVVELGESSGKFAVVGRDGLSLISPLQRAMLVRVHGQKLKVIAEHEVRNYPTNGTLVPDPADPRQPPVALPEIYLASAGAICAVVTAGDDDGRVGVDLRTEVPLDFANGMRTTSFGVSGKAYADYVFVTPGMGALVATEQTYLLITDRGVRFPAANVAVLGLLGYDGIEPLRPPSSVIDLIPEGPALDPSVATTQLTAGAPGPDQ